MDTQDPAATPTLSTPLLDRCRAALAPAEALVAAMADSVVERLSGGGGEAMNIHQTAAHGYAWASTYATALKELLGWAERVHDAGHGGPLEAAMLEVGFG